MSKLIIHNQAVYDGLTKDLSDEKFEYIDNVLQYKAVVLHEEYTDSELKAISKFFNDWFKDTYIYGSDAIEVVDGVKEEKKEPEFHCRAEESKWQDLSACNDCPNKCEEWYQWDKEMRRAWKVPNRTSKGE